MNGGYSFAGRAVARVSMDTSNARGHTGSYQVWRHTVATYPPPVPHAQEMAKAFEDLQSTALLWGCRHLSPSAIGTIFHPYPCPTTGNGQGI